jgi:PIN domain nuclease of toxin-antitoxin system
MRILFDTHALIWFLSDSPRLPTDIRALLLRQDTHLFFSPVSVLEIAIKHSLKPEAMPCTADAVYADAIASGIEETPFVSRHAQRVGALPWIHRDPFDRMLVAQARTEGMILLSHDGDVIRYGDGIKGF